MYLFRVIHDSLPTILPWGGDTEGNRDRGAGRRWQSSGTDHASTNAQTLDNLSEERDEPCRQP